MPIVPKNTSLEEKKKQETAQRPTLPTRKIGGRTVVFDPRRRGGTGLGGEAGSPTNIMEAQTVQEISDIANAQQKIETEKTQKVPVVGQPAPPPTPVEAPKTITPEEDIAEITRKTDKQISDIQAETGRTTADVVQEIAQVRAQGKQEIDAINFEKDLEKKMRTAEKEDFTYDKFVASSTAIRDIAEKQNVDMNVAEGIYNNQVTAAAKLDPADKESYGRIISRYDTEGFDQKEAYNVAIAEYEKDGIDADDMTKAHDAVKSRYGANFADEMSDEYLTNVRKISPEIVQGDRKLIDARKLGNSVASGKGGAREANAYLKTLFDIGVEYVPDGINKILASNATDDAKRQASAFAQDFYSDVETGIAPKAISADAQDKRYFIPEDQGGMNEEERNQYLTRKGQLAAAGRKPIAGFSADVGAGTDYPNFERSDVISAKKFIKDEFGTRYLSQNPDTLVEFLDEMELGKTLDDIGDDFRARQVSVATQNAEMYRQSFENVASIITGKDNKKTFIDAADRRFQKGDITGTKEFIKLNARNSGGVDQRNKIVGAEFTMDFLNDIEEDLREYEAAGGKIGIFSGTKEEIAKRVGVVLDPERRKIATKIAAAIQNYRRSMSGVAFSVPESEEYKAMFPDIQSNLDLNLANLSALNEVMALQLENFYSLTIGKTPYEAIFKAKPQEAEIEFTGTDATSAEQYLRDKNAPVTEANINFLLEQGNEKKNAKTIDVDFPDLKESIEIGFNGDPIEPADVLTLIQKHTQDPDIIKAVAAITQQESSPTGTGTMFTRAVSPVGALGLGQLMPDTAKARGVTNPFDPDQNIRGTVEEFVALVKRFGDTKLALASYNHGQGNVNKLLTQKGATTFEEIAEFLPEETKNYVARITRNLS